MEWYSFLFGIAGTFIGGLITFIFNLFQKRSEKVFQMSVEIRKSIMELYTSLSDIHGDIMKKYYKCSNNDFAENIMMFKDNYDNVLEAYKMFRIHLGDLKAYEVQSSIYNYYYELVYKSKKDNKKIHISKEEFEEAYRALKDTCGIMINDVRFALVEINSLKKLTHDDKKQQINEYFRYSNRVVESINDKLRIKKVIDNYNSTEENKREELPQHRLMIRVNAFVEEYEKRGGKADFNLPKLVIKKEK